MEAVPRLPMINFDQKISPENVDFASKLKQLITSVGEDASTYEKEIKELETLRASSCIRVAETVEGVSTLKRYYCQLLFLKSRFKIGSDGPFQFSWRDIYSGTEYSVSDMSHELAAVLYNIGALHSRLGVAEERQDSDGMKMAVAHFQCSAWAFHSLPDQFPQDSDSDLSSEVLAFKSQLCLAQAQECILEKSLLDCRKPGIVTKVCGQVVEYYKQALKQLEMSGAREITDHMDSLLDIVGNRQSRNWRSFMDFKVCYYTSLSLLQSGMLSEEGGRWGERVAFYLGSSNSLAQAAKLAKEYKLDQVYKGVTDTLVYTSDVVNGKLEISKKENEFIYHQKVPELDSLPTIKGASLVKGIPFDPSDPEVSGPDLFSRIVPMEAHEASSLYSEEQAKMLRSVCGEIEVANASMVLYLSSMQLEDIPNTTSTLSLPQELVECAAGLSVRPHAVSQLQEAMAKLASVSADVEASLVEIQQMLKEEEVKETEFQSVVGRRPRSIMTEMERETQKYHQAHSMASESNLTLHKAMQLHVENLKLLARPVQELNANVPTLVELDQQTQDSLEDMRKIMSKVDEMKSQRAQLEGELRAGVQNDDITECLARKGAVDQGKIFEEEMRKHGKTVQLIRQNIQAQSNIVRAMTERNAVYADARIKVDEVMKKREEVIGSLVASYHAYEDLLNKTTKGLEFYDKLDVNVSKLLARVGGVVKVQEEERTQQFSSSALKAADARALSLSLISGGYKTDFTPGAPPPDTPASALTTVPAPTAPTPGGRPKLSDYLTARKNKTSTHSNPPPLDTTDKPPPGIRPQPVGSENDPPYSSSASLAQQTYQHPYPIDGGNIIPTNTTSTPQYHSMPPYHTTPTSYHNSVAQAAYSTHLATQLPGHGGHQAGYLLPGQGVPGYQVQAQQHLRGFGAGQRQQMPSQQVLPGGEKTDAYGQQPGAQQHMPGHVAQCQQGAQPIPGQTMSGAGMHVPPVSGAQNQQVHGQQGQGIPQQATQAQVIYGNHQMHPQGISSQHNSTQLYQSQQGCLGPQVTGHQQTPDQRFQGHQSYVQGVQGQQIYGQRTQGQQMYVQGPHNHQITGFGTHSLQMMVQGTQMPRQSNEGQMYVQGTQGQQIYVPGTQDQQMTGQSRLNQQISRHGTQGQQMPVQETQSQQIPVQRTQGQQMAVQGTMGQPLQLLKTQGQQMPVLGVQGQQKPVQVMQSQQMPGQGTDIKEMYGQGTHHNMPAIQSHQTPGHSTTGYQPPGQQVPMAPASRQCNPGQGLPPSQQMSAMKPQKAEQQTPSQSQQKPQPTAGPVVAAVQPQAVAATPTLSILPNINPTNLDLLSGISLSNTAQSVPPARPAVPMPGTSSNSVLMPGTSSIRISMTGTNSTYVPSASTNTVSTILPQPHVSEEDRVARLSQEVERLQNLVSNFSSKTLGGQSPLEAKWKEVLVIVESNRSKHSVSVARCYPAKNRVPDVLPFDQNRVVLKDTKDDYINASRISAPEGTDCGHIITQAPSSKSMGEFWSMVWQEGVETMVCLVIDQELGQGAYIPKDKSSIAVDGFTIALKSTKSHPTYVERVINITNSTSKQTRAMVQLQMVGWPGPDLPLSPACLLDTATATLALRRQQRVASRPVLVHCLDGGNKSATFLSILYIVEEMDSLSGVSVPGTQGWPDICTKLGHLMLQRKGVVRDKQYLKLVYECLLYYMQDNLMKQGILNTGNTSVLVNKKGHSRHPSHDFVGISIATLKDQLIKGDPANVDVKLEKPADDTFTTADDSVTNENQAVTSPVPSQLSEAAPHTGPSASPAFSQISEAAPHASTSASLLKNIPDDLTKLADLNIMEAEARKPKKITKDDFLNPTRQVGKVDESDPLSQLDPLWSLK